MDCQSLKFPIVDMFGIAYDTGTTQRRANVLNIPCSSHSRLAGEFYRKEESILGSGTVGHFCMDTNKP